MQLIIVAKVLLWQNLPNKNQTQKLNQLHKVQKFNKNHNHNHYKVNQVQEI